MSSDLEETLLEDALRNDLPSLGTEARLRRRLLAAGIAVGNGVVVSTATAAAPTVGVFSGMAAKVAALSWGVKLGVLAAVAVPSVGLWLESAGNRPRSLETVRKPVPAASVAAASRGARGPLPALAAEPEAPSAEAVPATETQAPSGPVRVVARPTVVTSPPVADEASGANALAGTRPSSVAFDGAMPEPALAKAPSTLAEETRLLDSAFAAIAAGNDARAAELIREHEQRFPNGLLARERERAKLRVIETSRGH
jgi:hypothetical protein